MEGYIDPDKMNEFMTSLLQAKSEDIYRAKVGIYNITIYLPI